MRVGVYVDGYQRLNPRGFIEQDAYLKALGASGSVDHIEYGKYITGIRNRPLAVKGPRPRSGPEIVTSQWPVMIQSTLGTPLADAVVVVSNDSDLKLPVLMARERLPVGHVNPRGGYFAGDLTGDPMSGAGRHWWRKLTPADFQGHQLPDPAGKYTKPSSW